MQKEDFLQAIAADPGNTRLRLMYADWLEERGDLMAKEWRQPLRGIPQGQDWIDSDLGDGGGYGDGSDYGYGAAEGDGGWMFGDWGGGLGREDGDGTDEMQYAWYGQFPDIPDYQSLAPSSPEDAWSAEEEANPLSEVVEEDTEFKYYEARRHYHNYNRPHHEPFPWQLLMLGGFSWVSAIASVSVFGLESVSPIPLIMGFSSLLGLGLFAWLAMPHWSFKISPRPILLLSLGGIITGIAALTILYFALVSR